MSSNQTWTDIQPTESGWYFYVPTEQEAITHRRIIELDIVNGVVHATEITPEAIDTLLFSSDPFPSGRKEDVLTLKGEWFIDPRLDKTYGNKALLLGMKK